MSLPDYARLLDRVSTADPAGLVGLLAEAATALSGWGLAVYLVDFGGEVLEPLPDCPPEAVPEKVAASLAGRVYRTGEVLTSEREDGIRVWAPVVERAERTGVLALTVARIDDDVLQQCRRFGVLTGLLIRSLSRTTDVLHLSRRQHPMTLAASMQWDLLPPLVVRCPRATACGRLEPAYGIAGDVFDYAVNERYLEAAMFDAMGHGVASTMMATLALGAYRHSRRQGDELGRTYEVVQEVVAEHYGGESFVTALILRLDLERGSLEWVNAGHPRPLLMRRQRIVDELACAPSLPLGLGGACRQLGSVSLEPGDSLLVFTDGVIEGRSPEGEELGVERLGEVWTHEAASGHQPDEVLRRLVDLVLLHNAGTLRDDASLLQISWRSDS